MNCLCNLFDDSNIWIIVIALILLFCCCGGIGSGNQGGCGCPTGGHGCC